MGRRMLGMKGNGRDSWLIKSSGRVTGPFQSKIVEQKLLTREIVPLDEVVSPLGRWHYVIDDPLFSELARKMKDQEVDNERTMTSTLEASAADELTDTIEVHSGAARPNIPPSGIKGTATKVKSYGFQKDKNIEKEALVRSKMGLIGAVAVAVLLVVFVVYKLFSGSEGGDSQALANKGKAAAEFAEYDKAIRLLIEAISKDPKNTDAMIALIPLAAQQKDFVFAKRLIRQLEALQVRSPEVFNLAGLVGLMDQKYELAERDLDRALALNSRYSPALVNKMALSYLTKRYGEAVELFHRLEGLGGVDGPSTMLAVLAMVEQYWEKKSNEIPENAIKFIDNYFERSSDYRQEFLIAKNYIEFVLLKNGNAGNLTAILNIDPRLTQHHQHDLNVFQNHMQWDALLPWCKSIMQSAPGLVHAEALYGLCLMKNRRNLEADASIKAALKKNPNDMLVEALHSMYLIETHNEDKGLALLRHISESESYDLVLFLRGYYCKDAVEKDCASNSWRSLLQKNPAHLSALHGLAYESWMKGDSKEAKINLAKGLQLSSSFIPYKKLQWKIDQGIKD